jgi:hypothetical protein
MLRTTVSFVSPILIPTPQDGHWQGIEDTLRLAEFIVFIWLFNVHGSHGAQTIHSTPHIH